MTPAEAPPPAPQEDAAHKPWPAAVSLRKELRDGALHLAQARSISYHEAVSELVRLGLQHLAAPPPTEVRHRDVPPPPPPTPTAFRPPAVSRNLGERAAPQGHRPLSVVSLLSTEHRCLYNRAILPPGQIAERCAGTCTHEVAGPHAACTFPTSGADSCTRFRPAKPTRR